MEALNQANLLTIGQKCTNEYIDIKSLFPMLNQMLRKIGSLNFQAIITALAQKK